MDFNPFHPLHPAKPKAIKPKVLASLVTSERKTSRTSPNAMNTQTGGDEGQSKGQMQCIGLKGCNGGERQRGHVGSRTPSSPSASPWTGGGWIHFGWSSGQRGPTEQLFPAVPLNQAGGQPRPARLASPAPCPTNTQQTTDSGVVLWLARLRPRLQPPIEEIQK